jgi:hypothetical protein
MGAETKDGTGSASDIVRSGLAAAYEDGVDSWGEVPPTTQNQQPIYGFAPTPINQELIAATETSRSINKSRIQNIASFTISPDEIPNILDLLDARGYEDIVDMSIVQEIFNNLIQVSPEFTSRLEEWRGTFTQNMNNLIVDASQINKIVGIISATERAITKGNFIRSTSEYFKSSACKDKSENLLVRFYRGDAYDNAYASSRKLDYDLYGGSSGWKDPLGKLSRASGISKSTLGSKTISTMIIQGFYDAQIKLDFGVSPRFMERVTGIPRIDATSVYYGGDTGNPYYPTQIIAAEKYLDDSRHSDSTPGYSFPSIASIFHHPGRNSHSGDAGARSNLSNPLYIDFYGNDPGTTFNGEELSAQDWTPGSHPFHCIPAITKTMSLGDQLTYLSSIISTTLRSTAVIGAEWGSTANGTGDLGNIQELQSMAAADVGASYVGPQNNIVSVGDHVFATRQYSTDNITGIDDTDYPPKGTCAAYIFGGLPDSSTTSEAFRPAFMPFEIGTPESDISINQNTIGLNTSYKTAVLNSFNNIPAGNLAEIENVQSTLSDVLAAMSSLPSTTFLGNLTTCGRPPSHRDPDHEVSNQSLGLLKLSAANILQMHLDALHVMTTTPAGTSSAVASSMIAVIGTFFKSQSTGDSEIHGFLKKIFFQHMAHRAYRAIYTRTADPSQYTQANEEVLGTNPLGFHASHSPSADEPITWMPNMDPADSELQHPSDANVFGGFTPPAQLEIALRCIFFLTDRFDAYHAGLHGLFPGESDPFSGTSEDFETSSARWLHSLNDPHGLVREDPSFEIVKHILGITSQAHSVMDTIIEATRRQLNDTYDAANDMGTTTDLEERIFPNNRRHAGRTRVGGMDFCQLLALNFEIFCLLTESLFDSSAVCLDTDMLEVEPGHPGNHPSLYSDAGTYGGTVKKINEYFGYASNTETFGQGSFNAWATSKPMFLRCTPKINASLPGWDSAAGNWQDVDYSRIRVTVDDYSSLIGAFPRVGQSSNLMGPRDRVGASDRLLLTNWVIDSGAGIESGYADENELESSSGTTQNWLKERAVGSPTTTGYLGQYNGSWFGLDTLMDVIRDNGEQYSFLPEILAGPLSLIEHLATNISVVSSDHITDFGGRRANEAGDAWVEYTNSEMLEEIQTVLSGLSFEGDISFGSAKSWTNGQIALADWFAYGQFFGSDYSGNPMWAGMGGDPITLASGIMVGRQTPALDECAKLYLNSLDDSSTHSIFYFGVPSGLMEDHLIALANQEYTKYFTNKDSLQYTLGVTKSSEFLDKVVFKGSSTYNSKTFNDGLYLGKGSFMTAMQASPSDWNDLLNKLVVSEITNSTSAALPGGDGFEVSTSMRSAGWQSGTTDSKTGAEYIAEGREDELKSAAESWILKYLFYRITRLEIFETHLSKTSLNTVSKDKLEILIKDIVIPVIGERFTDPDSKHAEFWSKMDWDDISRLIRDQDPGGDSSVFELERNASNLKDLLEPKPVRAGPLVYMEEPKIQKAEQVITEILLGSIYAASDNVMKTIVLEPKMFDTVMAINFSDLNDQFDSVELANPDELELFLLTHGGSSYESVLHDAINGIVTVDNFTFRISSKLSTTAISV